MTPIELIMVEKGTMPGYEDYHGDILDSGYNKISTWDYDKKQRMYISSLNRTTEKPKRFYAPSVGMLKHKMENWLKNQNK